ncbi:hypothetical protein TTHERM_01082890 (macronuclear) [Tetrahymena thermophila SB210]|uniref:PH domain protein n=1 Tax=Tetrahymena thermophila (strain SB210) TaxID=312017 RepID=Q22BX9_TETTS|nr:hypothetical protein TTHERM_01082890 [Tetrahymena thermophila SB210]EAR82779.3 hypothetical protein TTHERM_01082890 [Tetrahymena thermophila SB210]|eukprot:XP_001030442.3 hypothetical protein TTHERM_01082890 [Tetrahymena thermophila SB210]
MNIQSNAFHYEQTVRKKQTKQQNLNDNSTPSVQSEQSFDENPEEEILNNVPVVRDLLIGCKPDSNNIITDKELHYLLQKLGISQQKSESDLLYQRIPKNSLGLVDFLNFGLFVCQDIKQLNLKLLPLCEITFRLGLEIFRVLTEENTSFTLKHLMKYSKKHKDLDIDFKPYEVSENKDGMKQIHTYQENTIENELNEYLLQNKPKSKGWLYRLSKKKVGKWSNLFFFINPTTNTLFSVKPTDLKRSINLEHIELYKCSFIEILETGQQNSTRDSKVKKKLETKQTLKTQENIINDNSEQEKKTFFVVDTKEKKTYLIRSEESMEVISVITILNNKKNNLDVLKQNDIYKYIENVDLEYTGIIDVAICKRNCINVFHSNLKNYTFKRQYLSIRQGKFMIYNVKTKDTLDLQQYNLIVDQNLPYAQSNPYSFALEKIQDHETISQQAEKTQKLGQLAKIEEKHGNYTIENQIDKEEGSIVAFNTQQAEINIEYEKKIGTTQTNNIQNNNNNKQVSADTQNKKSEGFFSKIFKRITEKKPDRLVLASDSEYKRKQWIFTINFYKSIILKIQNGEKIRFQTEENVNKHSILSQQAALYKYQQTKQKNNFDDFGLGKGLNDIDDQDDYYNVFNHQNDRKEEEKEIDLGQKKEEPKQPLKTQQKPTEDIQDKKKNVNIINTEGSQKINNNILINNKKTFNIQPNTTKNSQPQPYTITEPNEKVTNRLDSEEALLTLTFPNFLAENLHLLKQAQIMKKENFTINSKEIRTFTEKEICEKFIRHFFSFNHKHFEIKMKQHGLEKFNDLSFDQEEERQIQEGNQYREENARNENKDLADSSLKFMPNNVNTKNEMDYQKHGMSELSSMKSDRNISKAYDINLGNQNTLTNNNTNQIKVVQNNNYLQVHQQQSKQNLQNKSEKKSIQEVSLMEYCLTEQDEEPTAKIVFNKNHKYIVNKNQTALQTIFLSCLL